MTGFGYAEKDGFRVEIRSLNHRFLDIYFKLPPLLSQYEMIFRNIIRERFTRGKIDINIYLPEFFKTEINVNSERLHQVYSIFKKIKEELSLTGEIDINSITGMREMFIDTVVRYDENVVMDVFNKAVDNLYEMRYKEGEILSKEIHSLTDSIEHMNNEMKRLCVNTVSENMQKFNERLKLILDGKNVDDNRILQEAAIIATRLDITEEISRIESHLMQFREILDKGGSVGRKLDFIIQEINREVNTIGSKTSDYSISRLTVDMKADLEKIREQVQNLQ